jgi:hypothetical protein
MVMSVQSVEDHHFDVGNPVTDNLHRLYERLAAGSIRNYKMRNRKY